jgi:anti-anti-sigma factor
MGIDRVTVADVKVIRMSGVLDHASAGALREGVYAVLLQRQARVLVNLDRVPRIDAAGLGALAHVHRMASIVGATVTLVGVTPRVRDLLDVTGLSGCFEIAASECEAVEDMELCVRN